MIAVDKVLTMRNVAWTVAVAVVLLAAGLFFFGLDPVNDAASTGPATVFQISAGDGFRTVAQNLYAAHLIQSPFVFDLFSLADGRAFTLHPGRYRLHASMDVPQIVAAISGDGSNKVVATIPEGSNMYDIDRILSDALVIRPGEFARIASAQDLEGRLFPDTYQFYTDENAQDVVKEMTDNFNDKAMPLLVTDPANEDRDLIIASIIEKEVPGEQDREVVAGIIIKRLSEGMPLDIDATVCYAKFIASPSSAARACSLSALDFKIDSPYNTYLYKGLPPGSIGNPGTSAITAALHPQSSPYLYYLSDPATGKTIFAKTLDEQNQNRVKYLESN